MAPIVRRLCLSLLLLMLPVAARSDKTSDPGFDTKVSKPMFTLRHPKLLFDEGHFNVQTTHNRYDAFALLATNDGWEVLLDANEFTLKDLTDANVLVIVNPLGCDDAHSPKLTNSPFKPSEIDAVYSWVAAGGSLLYICEHAPMGRAGSALAERFGVNFSAGYLADPAIADTTFGASTLVFSNETATLGDHITLRGRGPAEQVRRIRTYSGQSLAGPPGSVVLLKVTSRAQDFMIPGEGWQGPVPDSLKRSAAGRAQGLAFTVGKGRVVMLGEPAMFTAQLLPGPGGVKRKVGMNSPGFQNRQFALNILRWLGKGLN